MKAKFLRDQHIDGEQLHIGSAHHHCAFLLNNIACCLANQSKLLFIFFYMALFTFSVFLYLPKWRFFNHNKAHIHSWKFNYTQILTSLAFTLILYFCVISLESMSIFSQKHLYWSYTQQRLLSPRYHQKRPLFVRTSLGDLQGLLRRHGWAHTLHSKEFWRILCSWFWSVPRIFSDLASVLQRWIRKYPQTRAKKDSRRKEKEEKKEIISKI